VRIALVLLILASAVANAIASPAGVESGVGDAGISGAVYDDANQNGARDAGEFFLASRVITVKQGTSVIGTAVSTTGGYSFDSLAPGDYTVSAETDGKAPGICADSFGGFNPLRLDDCLQPVVPWPPTSPDSVDITLSDGEQAMRDFGARRADAMVLAGIAVLEDDYAPPGTVVEAMFNGQQCGSSQVVGGGNGIHNYELGVLAGSEIPGCPEPGEIVELLVGGVAAGEKQYQPTGGTSIEFAFFNPIGVQQYAWFWAEEPAYKDAVMAQPVVEAVVDGVVCKSTFVGMTTHLFSPVVGFQKLAVPSAGLQPGCGYPGATVTLRLEGQSEGTSLLWQPGIHYADMNLPGALRSGDTTCDRVVNSADALNLLRLSAGLPVNFYCAAQVGDVNCDGKRNAIDALLVLRFAAGLIVAIPPPPLCHPIGRSGP